MNTTWSPGGAAGVDHHARVDRVQRLDHVRRGERALQHLGELSGFATASAGPAAVT
jgi:hypothetical protein